MRNRLPKIVLIITILTSSCSEKAEEKISPFSDFELATIRYFKAVALGFEHGDASEITRKWNDQMKIFLDGDITPFLESEVARVVNEINDLATDGFSIQIVDNLEDSNCHVFFGPASGFIRKFPFVLGSVDLQFGYFLVWFQSSYIHRAVIFIETEQSNLTQQESVIREEITQALGLGKDSPSYPNSIFYETVDDGGFVTEYAAIDKELIRLLYHPEMSVGLNRDKTDLVLKQILSNE